MSDNIFDYNPTREWNGQVINFGNISLSDNLNLTIICFDSEGAQQATSQVSTTKYNADTYHNINETIRQFFAGEDLPTVSYTGGELEDAELIYSFFVAGVEYPIYTSLDGHEIFLYKPDYAYNLFPEIPLSSPTGCYVPDHIGPKWGYNDEILCIAAGGVWIIGVEYPPAMAGKGLEGPRSLSTWTSYSTSLDPVLTNKPQAHVSWSGGALDARCQDPAYTNQSSCEASTYESCRSYHTGEEMWMTPYNFNYYNQTFIPAVWNPTTYVWPPQYTNFPTPEAECVWPRWSGCWVKSINNASTEPWQLWSDSYSQQSEADCMYRGYYYLRYSWHVMWIPPEMDHEPNHWHSAPNSWWPSTETQDEVMGQIIYASKSVYDYPNEWSSLGVGVSQLDLTYNETAMTAAGNSYNGIQMIGRESLVFWVGYQMRDTVRDMFICSDGSAKNQADCLAAGECSIAAGNASEAACLALMNDADPPANAGATWTPFNYTWDFDLTQDIRITRTGIEEDNWATVAMDAHAERLDSAGQVTALYGYTNNYGGTKIQWSAPQYLAYGYPTKYYVYKSNEYYYGITSPTDYTRGIKHFIGEVPHTTDTGLHYFEEDANDLQGEGVAQYQPVRYYVTGVWTTTDPTYSTPSQDLNWERYDQGYFWDQFNWFSQYTPTSTGTWNQVNYAYNGGQQNYYSYRVYGYYKAVTTGYTQFWMQSDDASWLWIGNAGETVADLETRRNAQNMTINNSGTHGAQSQQGSKYLTAGSYYPLLSYYGENDNGYYYWNNAEVYRIQTAPYGYGWTYYGSYYQDQPQVTNAGGQPHPQEREGQFPNSVQSSYT